MHGGPGMMMRQALQQARYAPARQQALISVGFIAAGIVLALVGHVVGLLLTLVGVRLAMLTVRNARRARRVAKLPET